MALRHNKKKNGRIVYEQLMILSTRLALSGHAKEANHVIKIIKERFSLSTMLGKEKKVFDSILEVANLKGDDAQTIISEALEESRVINDNSLEKERLALINCVIRELGKDLFSIPIKEYKLMASAQILLNESRNNYRHSSPKERVDIKNMLKEHMTRETKSESYEMDNFTFKILKRKFNEKYSAIMNEDQREILAGWLGFLMTNDSPKFRALLEEKVEKAKEEIDYVMIRPEHASSDYSKMLNEARVGLETDYTTQLNENNVLKVMKYFDLVEDLREIKDGQK